MDSTLWRLCYDGGPAPEADWFTDCCTLSTLLIGEAGIGFPSSLIPADCPSIKAGCSLLIRATVEQITRWTSQCLGTPYACLYYISSERTYKSCASLSDVRSTFCREFYGTCLERLKIRDTRQRNERSIMTVANRLVLSSEGPCFLLQQVFRTLRTQRGIGLSLLPVLMTHFQTCIARRTRNGWMHVCIHHLVLIPQHQYQQR
jgi:hypothetical protein